MPHRLVKADYLVKNAPLIAIVGFGLLMAAALAVAFLVVRSNRADMLVNHTIRVESTARAAGRHRGPDQCNDQAASPHARSG